ncbi:60S ribosomal protein L30 [Intoshia linei]|uniref:Large ribosomal subunit protein eL30 n=1 Tax=Intoshia linei TaxID=1819745 RepID=A0A177BBG9_9BILA|nr:60S ribosomal protein L30 [Intoshia linei]
MTSKKKSAQSTNSKLSLAAKTGKCLYGYKEALRSMRARHSKLVIIPTSISPTRTSLIEYYAMLTGVAVHHYEGNATQLGIACGKKYNTGTVSIVDAGDSDIIKWMEDSSV